MTKHFLQVYKFAVFVAAYRHNYITSQWFIVDECLPVRTKLILCSAVKHQKDGEVLLVAISLLHMNPHVFTCRRLPVCGSGQQQKKHILKEYLDVNLFFLNNAHEHHIFNGVKHTGNTWLIFETRFPPTNNADNAFVRIAHLTVDCHPDASSQWPHCPYSL